MKKIIYLLITLLLALALLFGCSAASLHKASTTKSQSPLLPIPTIQLEAVITRIRKLMRLMSLHPPPKGLLIQMLDLLALSLPTRPVK